MTLRNEAANCNVGYVDIGEAYVPQPLNIGFGYLRSVPTDLLRVGKHLNLLIVTVETAH